MQQRSTIAAAAVAALLAVGCSSDPEGGGRTPEPLPSGERTPGATGEPVPRGDANPGRPRDLATGLEVPWAIAFLPGGDALVTERDSAKLLRVTPQGRVATVGEVPGVEPGGEGGLMGVAPSPSYARDRTIFLYFTAASDNRVVRFRHDEGAGGGADGAGRISGARPIVTGIPKAGNHNGGRIAFGPDKMLYIGTGESGNEPLAQDKDSLGGKILRVTPDGRPAPGNPFGTRVWTYGHRNVQGLAWDEKGRMFATEFGQDRFDEVNRIEKGKNYGWPEVEGVGGDGKYADPLLTWSTDEASPSGLAYAEGSLWAVGLRGRRLWQVPVGDGGKAGKPRAHLADDYGRLRAAARAPDGSLWLTTSNRDGRGDPGGKDDRVIVLPLR